ncbi:MAG: sugar phosphate isomerase/epimerase family protein [Acidobacteriota bacterium]
MNRRLFLASAAAASSMPAAVNKPVGLELFSVRQELARDLPATLRAVARMGYDGVEFFGPYADWTVEKAKEVKKLLDELNLKCLSAHTGGKYFVPDQLDRVIELNVILESRFMIMSSAGRVDGLDGWKTVAAKLNLAAEKLKPLKKATGFHNHALEFKPVNGVKPIEVLARETAKDVVLQLDVGTCLEAETDPVAWVKANPGRIGSLHMKDWKKGLEKPHDGYQVLLGEGSVDWKAVVNACLKGGGAEHLLVEQEGSRFGELETAQKCLENFRRLMAENGAGK